MDDEDWIVVGEGVRGEWLSSPETLAAVHPPVLFVRDPLTDPADARALAMALARLGERVLWVDTESMSPPHSPSGPTADGADALWEREEGYPDRQAVRELDLLAGAMGPERPAVVGVGMGATWALLVKPYAGATTVLDGDEGLVLAYEDEATLIYRVAPASPGASN